MIECRAKEILDRYRPLVIRKDKVFLNPQGEAAVNTDSPENYQPENYSTDIVLQIAPKDSIILEFEDLPGKNRRIVAEVEEACRVLGLEYCVSGHKGKSDYVRIYNIKGVPVNHENKQAKELLIDTLLPAGAKEQLDTTNYGWTYSPVIGHPHWKPKYNGEPHMIIRGTHPLDQKNTYPTELLKKIHNMKKITKIDATELLKTNPWVNDFLISYCCENTLPAGSRHFVIEKNLAALIYHRTDADEITEKYLKAQGRKCNTLRTWTTSIANGKFDRVSVGELSYYIEKNNIPYEKPRYIKKPEDIEKTEKITPEEEKILKDPYLLINLIEVIQSVGVEGEENTILSLMNKTALRLVINHKPTSSNVIVSDVTGAGKDAVTGAVTKVMVPDDQLIHRTRFSDRALEYYMTNKEPDYTLDGKVIYLEDPEEDLIKSQAFRVMASGQSKVTVVKDQAAMELEVRGKPVMIVTSMNATVDEEGARRWDGLRVDVSPELTKIIIAKKLKIAAGEKDTRPKPQIVSAIQKLPRVEVTVPYAEILIESYSKIPNVIMRTQIDKLIDYIKASAAIHQFQREKDKNGRVIATFFDYEYATFLFTTLKDAEGGMMNVIEKRLLEILIEEGSPMAFRDIIKKGFPRTKKWLYEHLEDLKARNIVDETEEFDERSNKEIIKIFGVLGYSHMTLPTVDELLIQQKQQEANRLVVSVVTGISGQCDNQNQISCVGCNLSVGTDMSFFESVRGINEKRAKMGLKPLFLGKNRDSLSAREMLQPKSLQEPIEGTTLHNLPRKGVENDVYSRLQPIQPKKDDKNNEKEVSPLIDRIKKLREYCQKLTGGGIHNTYENLCWNYDKIFIDHCIAEGIIIKLPNGSYSAP